VKYIDKEKRKSDNQLNFLKKINIRELIALTILVIAACAAYSNTLDSSFHLDDERAIGENPPTFMREITWDNLRRAAFESQITTRPVAQISFAFNYYFHQLNVRGYHVVNILIHIFTGIFLYFLLKATLTLPPLREKYGGQGPVIISLITTAIWILHPLQTQSVTYIVQRMNSMSAMFYILAMLLYVKARLASGKKTTWALFAGCLISGLLALGSKELAATLPLFVFLYEWYFLQDLRLSRSLNKRQWYLLAAAILVFGGLALFYLGANPFNKILGGYAHREFTLTQKLLTESRVIILYISLLFFPHPGRLNLDYDFTLSNSIFTPITTFLSINVLIGLLLIAILTAKKQRLFSFCILWFLGNLFMESSFIPLELVFEHRTYLPSMFFLLLLVITLYRLLSTQRYVIYGIFAVILMILPYWTYERNKVWADELTLQLDCVKKSPNKWRVHSNLGKEYFRLWETDKAIQHYRRALQIAPNAIIPRNNLAVSLTQQKRYQEAIIQLEIILNKYPDNAKARKHLKANKEFLRRQQMKR
jgi:tetratricopeptide (TPR) repeat protein